MQIRNLNFYQFQNAAWYPYFISADVMQLIVSALFGTRHRDQIIGERCILVFEPESRTE